MGISPNKKEGDNCTPNGSFTFGGLFYRKDRVKNISTVLKKKPIQKNFGWCDDPRSKKYNKLIKFPFKGSAEKLFLKKNIYDIILVINYNRNPVVKNKGSAIFLHLADKRYSKTKGCVAVSRKDLIKILSLLSIKSKIIIN